MIIKYDFLDNTTSEVEVDDNLGKIIGEMDKDEFNLNRKETRRHDYISQLEEQGYYIADDCNLLDDVIKSERYKELMEAIEKASAAAKNIVDQSILEKGTPKGYCCRGRRIGDDNFKENEKNLRIFEKNFKIMVTKLIFVAYI